MQPKDCLAQVTNKDPNDPTLGKIREDLRLWGPNLGSS